MQTYLLIVAFDSIIKIIVLGTELWKFEFSLAACLGIFFSWYVRNGIYDIDQVGEMYLLLRNCKVEYCISFQSNGSFCLVGDMFTSVVGCRNLMLSNKYTVESLTLQSDELQGEPSEPKSIENLC